MYDNSSKVIEVDINEVLPNRFQPRIQFDETEILELSDSIKEHGVIQPLVVRTIGDKYEIIAGERRYKASVLAGKETVPVIIKNLDDKESAEVALIENVQRKNLTPIEEALSYKKILDMGYITQEDLAIKLGKSQSSVANKIRLLNLTDEVQEALLDNKISERHARSLLRLSTSKQQNEMLNRIISERLTVRKTDEEIDKIKELNIDSDIEKGELDMNNNMPEMPTQPQSTMPSFDIFGGMPQVPTMETVQPVTPVVEQPQPVMPSIGGMQFDANGTVVGVPTMEPVQPVTPVVEQPQPVMPSIGGMQFDANGNVVGVPTIEPVQPVTPVVEQPQPVMPSIGGMQFDANGNVVGVPTMEPVQPVTPVVEQPQPVMPSIGGMQFDANGNVVGVPTMESVQPVTPVVEQPQPVMPSIGGMQFDANGNVVGVPTMEPVQPVTPVVEQPQPVIPSFGELPEISPIIETPVEQPAPSIVEPEVQAPIEPIFEVPTEIPSQQPEPIIVTDFSKQYDPIMPQTMVEQPPTVDFKEVINAIRECSAKIEKYGFKIDVEEYDLANLYQAVFKIDKN